MGTLREKHTALKNKQYQNIATGGNTPAPQGHAHGGAQAFLGWDGWDGMPKHAKMSRKIGTCFKSVKFGAFVQIYVLVVFLENIINAQ